MLHSRTGSTGFEPVPLDVAEEPDNARPDGVRMVVRPAAESHCVWCGCDLPTLRRPLRFCPFCGGHQFAVCTCGSRAFDPAAQYCHACGSAFGD
jgi:hypothetical protein